MQWSIFIADIIDPSDSFFLMDDPAIRITFITRLGLRTPKITDTWNREIVGDEWLEWLVSGFKWVRLKLGKKRYHPLNGHQT